MVNVGTNLNQSDAKGMTPLHLHFACIDDTNYQCERNDDQRCIVNVLSFTVRHDNITNCKKMFYH
jgi:hypothetical protein